MTVTNKTTAYLVAILATIVVMCSCPVECLACAATSVKVAPVPMAESVSNSASVVNTDTHSPSAFIAQTATSVKAASVPMAESVPKSVSVAKVDTHSPAASPARTATSANVTSVSRAKFVSKSASVVKTMTHSPAVSPAQTVSVSPSTSLDALQRRFVDLRFGMFIHFNMPTYVDEDWPDPDASPELFNPVKLDCRQWARAAKSAGMTYGCLTTKHHSGFCIWDTKTTDYSVMSSPFKRDVVKEYVDAFRAENLDVMLYYSILDTHAHLRPGWIVPEHKDMVKNQLRELLTNYGKISAIIIDGWDAPWSRISYDQIPFEEIYTFIKSIQPDCLVMDLNSAKYPADALFYTDIKSYEQGAGQHIDKESNALPALSCLPIQKTWFWKSYFPQTPVKDAEMLVKDNIVPMGKAYCNFILNVAPNRDGLMDDNAMKALTQIGKIWAKTEPGAAGEAAKAIDPNYVAADLRFSECPAPIIASNLAKGRRADSSWSYDMEISEFAVDDDFESAWVANALGPECPNLRVYLDKEQLLNMIAITEEVGSEIREYRLDARVNGQWQELMLVHADAQSASADAGTLLSCANAASPGTASVVSVNAGERMSSSTGVSDSSEVRPTSASGGPVSLGTAAVVSADAKKSGRVTVLRFNAIYADAIRITVLDSRKTKAPDGVYRSGSTVAISELGVYLER